MGAWRRKADLITALDNQSSQNSEPQGSVREPVSKSKVETDGGRCSMSNSNSHMHLLTWANVLTLTHVLTNTFI